MDWNILSEQDRFRSFLDKTVHTKDYIFVDWPDYLNTGDHLIWLGAKYGLNSLGRRCIGEYTAWDVRSGAVSPPTGVTVVCSGGGNFGDLYPNFQETRHVIARQWKDCRVVVLPQTAFFKDPRKLEESRAAFNAHPDLHLVARDAESFQIMRGFTAPERSYMAPDCAFFLAPAIKYLLRDTAPRAAQYETLCLFREDGEKRTARTVPADSLVIDWLNPIETYAQHLPDLNAGASIAKAFGDVFGQVSGKDAISLERLILGIRLLELGSTVHTDRLHAHILSSLLGKKHTFFDNSYSKNKNYYEKWSKTIPRLTFAS